MLKARIVPNCDPRWLSVLPVIGFAGIARPEKFFATLRNNGARLIDDARLSRSSPLSASGRRAACSTRRRSKNAMLVTTEKDWVRLPDDDGTPLGELKHRSRPFPIVVKFEDEAAVTELLAREALEVSYSAGSGWVSR